jgi:hypothetical protein
MRSNCIFARFSVYQLNNQHDQTLRSFSDRTAQSILDYPKAHIYTVTTPHCYMTTLHMFVEYKVIASSLSKIVCTAMTIDQTQHIDLRRSFSYAYISQYHACLLMLRVHETYPNPPIIPRPVLPLSLSSSKNLI